MPDSTPTADLQAVVTGDKELAETTTATSTWHVPGAPLETVEDREANDARRDEPVAETLPPAPAEYDGIDTRTPEGNLATRSNIVSDGPGTVPPAG